MIVYIHLPTCNTQQDWSKELEILANTPEHMMDDYYFEALADLNNKKDLCNCEHK